MVLLMMGVFFFLRYCLSFGVPWDISSVVFFRVGYDDSLTIGAAELFFTVGFLPFAVVLVKIHGFSDSFLTR